MRVTNGIPLGCPRFLPVDTVNCVQTLKGEEFELDFTQPTMPVYIEPPMPLADKLEAAIIQHDEEVSAVVLVQCSSISSNHVSPATMLRALERIRMLVCATPLFVMVFDVVTYDTTPTWHCLFVMVFDVVTYDSYDTTPTWHCATLNLVLTSRT
jgi:hypothetical protein